ncbi:Protein-disulfide isomerase [Paracoccus isoporae]|uniref:Protein-disulfide isomerase n=1 Tax=Paracoccus isoporae TaxID=591205 RepID=A0A1G6UIY1_9RHOB|nr:DsbA family protein [Paracoccus isoporae]SDD40676.1 Protein-disulfide isomerase [Paracoccus isoporae]
MTFELRHLLTASLFSAALSMPAFAQDSATQADDAETAAESSDAAESETAAQAEPQILDDVVLGDESAPLTIYEYASFTCPHCAAFHEDGFPQLKSEYIDTGKVRFIQRDVYFDQVGLWAGILARCDEDKFYPVADMLMGGQDEWMGAKNGEELVANLRKIGAKAGMTAEQIDACWADGDRVADLVATFQHNAAEDEINATPTFMIGGEQVSNQPWTDLKAVIDEKLAEAEDAAPAE